jgi:hypothetical protein
MTPHLPDLIGVWVAAFLTLCIFSFLFKDNPFYKFAEYLFVGCSAGYWMAIQFNEVLVPNLWNRLVGAWTKAGQGALSPDWVYLVPAALGTLMILRLFPKIAWVSRWPLAFLVGINAGFTIVYYMQARILKQIDATILPLWFNPANPQQFVQNSIIVVGVLCALVYFYFSVEHRGVFGGASRVGIYVLMIALGASFGYTVMARVSLLIGRMLFFKNDFWPITHGYFWGS